MKKRTTILTCYISKLVIYLCSFSAHVWSNLQLRPWYQHSCSISSLFYIQIFKLHPSSCEQPRCKKIVIQQKPHTNRVESIVIHWKHTAVQLLLLCSFKKKTNLSSRKEKWKYMCVFQLLKFLSKGHILF